MKIRAIITGATGMVGEGVLHECLQHPDVEAVLSLSRKASGVVHPKFREVLVKDFFDLDAVEHEMRGYNACFFCLGLSSVGLDEAEYTRLTFDLTAHFAETLVQQSPNLTFCFVSGAGTDNNSSLMWARVKGRAENYVMQLPFKQAYAFRPGYLHPTRGLKNVKRFYFLFTWLYPLLRLVMPGSVSTLRELGLAMINAVHTGYSKRILEVRDIVKLAKGVSAPTSS